MAAKVQSWSQQFEYLNVLGFQGRLARMCGLSVCPDRFLLFARTQNGRGKMAAKCQVPIPMGYKSSKFVVGKRDSIDM